MTRTSSTTRVFWADCASLFGAVFASSLPYVFRLGFYSDDWATLAIFSRLGILKGMRQILFADVAMRSRPVQLVYLALNFKAFGLHPVPYHFVASVLLGIATVCLYLTARELTVPRSTAFAIALIFGFLPHYSTDRVWISSQQAVLCVIFALLGVRALNRAEQRSAQTRIVQTIVAALLFALSLLSYEVAFGLIIASLALAAWRTVVEMRTQSKDRHLRLGAVTGISVLFAAALVFKLRVQRRISIPRHFSFRFLPHLWGYLVHAAVQMIHFDFLTYGLRMPEVLGDMYRASLLGGVAAIMAVALGAFASACLWRHMITEETPGWRYSLTLMVSGCVVFLLGYLPFLLDTEGDFTTAGLDNRVNIASAVGAACMWVVIAGLVSRLLPAGKARSRAFSLATGLICFANSFAVFGIAECWADAANRQAAILQSVSAHVPQLPPGSILLLDGFCRYRGPGVVFETDWDATGAMEIALNDWSVRSDVVSANLRFDDTGAATRMYDAPEGNYHYGSKLFIFNTQKNILVALPSKQAALTYLRLLNPTGDGGCAHAYEGIGEKLF